MATSYSFPLMSNHDIAEFFSQQMNPPIRVSESDLKSIKSQMALRLYSTMWEAIMDIDSESVTQPPFNSVTADYYELHDVFVQTAIFSRALRWLLAQAGVDDFKLTDIKDPKPKRTNKFLSALVNYYFFVCQRIQVYDDLKASKEEEEEMLGSLRDANDALQRQIDDLKHDRAAMEPECDKLGKQADTLESELNELVLQKREVVQRVTDLQTKVTKLGENTERQEEQATKGKEELKVMEAQIIQSPARMTAEIQNLVEKKNKVRLRESEQRERLAEMERKMKDEDKFLRDTETVLKIVKEVSELLEKEVGLMHERTDLESRTADVQMRCTDLVRQLEALDQECENRQQIQQRAQASKQVRIASLRADIKARETALEKVKENALKKKCEYQSRLKEIQNIQHKANEKIAKDNEHLDMMKAKYAHLLETLDKYHTRLAAQHSSTTEKIRQFIADSSDASTETTTDS